MLDSCFSLINRNVITLSKLIQQLIDRDCVAEAFGVFREYQSMFSESDKGFLWAKMEKRICGERDAHKKESLIQWYLSIYDHTSFSRVSLRFARLSGFIEIINGVGNRALFKSCNRILMQRVYAILQKCISEGNMAELMQFYREVFPYFSDEGQDVVVQQIQDMIFAIGDKEKQRETMEAFIEIFFS